MFHKELLLCSATNWTADLNITVGSGANYWYDGTYFGWCSQKFGTLMNSGICEGIVNPINPNYTSRGSHTSLDGTTNPKPFGGYSVGLVASPSSLSYGSKKVSWGGNAPILQFGKLDALGTVPSTCRLTRLDTGATVTSDVRNNGYAVRVTNGVPQGTAHYPIYSYEITNNYDARRIIFESEYGSTVPVRIELFD